MVFHITLSRLFTEHIYNFFVPYKKADGFADINTKLLGTKMQLMHFLELFALVIFRTYV